MKLLLFDIDLTLINTAGAGRRAMIYAFEELFGAQDGMSHADFAGRTDTGILKDALNRQALDWSSEIEEKFKQAYFEHLKRELRQPNPKKRVLPGILEILDILITRPKLKFGLLTGNWREGARIKLEHFNIYHYFLFGAFSDDSGIRSELPRIAARRFEQTTGQSVSPHDVYIIGDTPHDVACSRPFGAKSVAVATGLYSFDQLQAAQPDFLFQNLSDYQSFLRIFD